MELVVFKKTRVSTYGNIKKIKYDVIHKILTIKTDKETKEIDTKKLACLLKDGNNIICNFKNHKYQYL